MNGVSVYMKTLRDGLQVRFTTPLLCRLNFGTRDFSAVLPDALAEEGPHKAAFMRGEKVGIEMDAHTGVIQLLPV